MPIPASSVLPTVDDLKAHVNILTTTHDAELQDMLDAAVEVVEGYVGPLDGGSVTETHYAPARGLPIVLRQVPVVAVTSVSSSVGTTYTSSDYVLDGAAGLLRAPYGWAGDVTVAYTTGRTSLPASIRLAILIVAAHLWETQMGGGNAVPPYPGADVDGAVPAGFAVPNRAMELLRPYLRGPAVA